MRQHAFLRVSLHNNNAPAALLFAPARRRFIAAALASKTGGFYGMNNMEAIASVSMPSGE